MPLDMAFRLLDLLHELGVTHVVLIGGETLFWPHIFSVATYIKRLGMTSTVVTNGWLLGHPRFADRVACSDITAINISLKGGNKQQFVRATGLDGFDTVVAGIRTACAWEHIDTGISTVVSKDTVDNIDELARVAFGNGAKMLSYSMCGPVISGQSIDGQYMPDPRVVVSAFVKKYETIDKVSNGRFSIENSLPTCLWPTDFLRTLTEKGQINYGCHFKLRNGVIFDRWGQTIPCNHLYDYPMGQYGKDFVDRESFQAFWENPQLETFYNRMLAYPSNRCVTCETFNECGGGCPLIWFVRKPEDTIPLLQEVQNGQT